MPRLGLGSRPSAMSVLRTRGDLQDAGASGEIVVGSLLDVPFEQVGAEDDLARFGVRAGDDGDDVLEMIGDLPGLHLGPNGDRFSREKPLLEQVPFAGGEAEPEDGLGRRRGRRHAGELGAS